MATTGSPQSREPSSYASLLERAHEKGLESVSCEVLAFPGDYNDHRAVVRVSTVFTGRRFSALGEAQLNGNQSPGEPACSAGELLELAETRAKIRAFSDALNGSTSRETSSPNPRPSNPRQPSPSRSSTASNGQENRPSRTGNGTDSAPTRGNSTAMTSAQRRFLFRLVCEQGTDPKEASSRICELAEVRSLGQISKAQASELIDSLQQGRPQAGDRSQGGEGDEDVPF